MMEDDAGTVNVHLINDKEQNGTNIQIMKAEK